MVKFVGNIINLIGWFAPRRGAAIALKLFSSPRKGKIRDIDYPVIASAFYEEIDFGKNSIGTYRWIGDKETILLAHGWESNSARWKDLIKLLKDRSYTVIALDAPAHGNSSGKEFNALSYAEFIHAVAQKFNPEIVIGHSVGGMATIFCQQKYQIPGLNQLVLLGAPAHFKGVFTRYNGMMGYSSKVGDAMAKRILEKFGNPPEYYDAAVFSREIHIPTLLIHDKDDLIIPYDDAELYHNNLPNSKLMTTENQGHSLKSQEVNQAIVAFIASKNNPIA